MTLQKLPAAFGIRLLQLPQRFLPPFQHARLQRFVPLRIFLTQPLQPLAHVFLTTLHDCVIAFGVRGFESFETLLALLLQPRHQLLEPLGVALFQIAQLAAQFFLALGDDLAKPLRILRTQLAQTIQLLLHGRAAVRRGRI